MKRHLFFFFIMLWGACLQAHDLESHAQNVATFPLPMLEQGYTPFSTMNEKGMQEDSPTHINLHNIAQTTTKKDSIIQQSNATTHTAMQKPTFTERLKRHFFDTDTYRERMQNAEATYENFMQLMEHEGTYFLYTYSLPPFGIYGNNVPSELKFQLSLKVPLWRGAFWSKGSLFFGYTQTAWFQQFNSRYSNPVRDTNYRPSIFYSYPANWNLFGGKLKELRIGYLHFSNGIGGDECERVNGVRPPTCRSRSMGNRIMFEAIWEIKNFGVHITAWPYIPKRRDNPDIAEYMGYASLRLYYTYKRHFAEIHIAPIISDYTRYHGSVQLGYAYKVNKYFALYGQYFYGYGNSLYEYNIPVQRIGVGIRATAF